MEIELVALDDLIPDKSNTKKHPEKNLDVIKGSLKKWNQVEPLVVQKSTGVIIGGNGRYEVMKQLGWTECNVIYVDVTNTEAAALSITLNRSSELGEWDQMALPDVLKGLQTDGFDLGEIGFDASDMAEFEIPDSAMGKEFDESAADDVKFLECPECGHKWAK